MQRNKIVVITPTVRLEGLPIVQKALEEQTFVDFDWLVCSKEEPRNCWATWIPDNFKGGFWTLNRAYNALIKASECDLVVSWQDFTYAGKNTLNRFWKHYQCNEKRLVSAKGNKYTDDTWMEKTWTDPRPDGMANYKGVEWNLCSCPKKGLDLIGGFIDEMDFLGYGMDGFSVNERLALFGYEFYVDSKIESYSIGHGRIDNWDENNLCFKWNQTKNYLISRNLWPDVANINYDNK